MTRERLNPESKGVRYEGSVLRAHRSTANKQVWPSGVREREREKGESGYVISVSGSVRRRTAVVWREKLWRSGGVEGSVLGGGGLPSARRDGSTNDPNLANSGENTTHFQTPQKRQGATK
ncbi:hypothetical protein E2C01_052458 [Portunus trituberculatus]|uniref:Uncharacterized protein n=1 Tax=Portunus trituberculatus TaxID=210409 RepID=A0A5B7GLV3_PORTR|nr:hypothetical protein [Portunus trituberculatus]